MSSQSSYSGDVNKTDTSVLHVQRFINPPATEYNSTHLLATQASSRLSLSQQLPVTLKSLGPVPIPLAPQTVNKCHITYMASDAPTVSRARNAQGTQDHIKFTAYFETACLPHPPLIIKNIIIIKVRSDLGIASPGRFAWAWGGLLLRHCR